MKKIIILLGLITLLTSCTKTLDLEIDGVGVQDSQIIASAEVEMLISEIDEQQIHYLLLNHGSQSFTYGLMFTIEVFHEGAWQNVALKKGVAFDAIGFTLEPMENVKGELDYFLYFPTLPKGQYRLVKALFNEELQMQFAVAIFSID